MIYVFSDAELEIGLSKATRARTWQSFKQHGTRHSSLAATLPSIIRRCEKERIPYRLTAWPGEGYHIEMLKEPNQ